MKIETKRKIIRVVKCLINYKVTKDEGLAIPVSINKIKKHKVSMLYSHEEIKKIAKGQIEFGLGLQLVDNLRNENHVKFEYIDTPEGTKVEAKLIILKL